MSNVDFTEYVELDLIDRDPQDIFDIAIEDLKIKLPDWRPREGNIEVLLLESMALEVAESVFSINRLPSAIAEILLSMLDIERDDGAPPTVDLRFEMGVTTGTTLPAGITAVLQLDNGLEPVVFTTDSELVIPPGATYGVVSATGDRYTSDANDTPAETLVELNDNLIYVNYAKLNSTVTGGVEPEDDIDFITRGVQRLQRLTTTLLLPSHFVAAALEFAFVKRAKALDMYNSAADVAHDGPVGNDPGYIAVAVYGDNENVSVGNKTILSDYFDANSMANLVTTIIDPTITTVNVTASVVIEKNALASD